MVKRYFIYIILLICPVLFLCSCASIVNGTKEHIQINADPKESTVKLLTAKGNIIKQEKGSLYHEVSRKKGYFQGNDYSVEVSADGYKTTSLALKSRISGWYIGNILFGGFIGWFIVDPITGGMWVFDASDGQDVNDIQIKLVKEPLIQQ